MRGSSNSAVINKTIWKCAYGRVRGGLGVRRPVPVTRRARRGGRRRWPYGWLAAPVAAALVAAWAAAVPLPTAGTFAQAGAVTGLLAGSAVLAVTPGVALLSVVARYRRLGPATALGLLYAGAGVTAWGGFWAWFASPAFGGRFGPAVLAISVVVIAIFGRRGDLGRCGLSLPLALALAVSVLYTGIAFLRGGPTANPMGNIAHLFWPEPDSSIPLVFATKLAAHAPLGGYLIKGGWLSSDRPPLETGFVLLQWPWWNAPGGQGGYQFLGTVLQSAWLPALWAAFRVRGVSAGRTCAAVLATAATGAVYVNTLYVWPKMLAGALALCALAILVSRNPGDRWRGAGVLAAVLAALSMLSHGGTAFGLLALGPFAVPPWRKALLPLVVPPRRKITAWAAGAGAAAAVAVLYVPWTLYQHFVDPPGDRLLKWMLAGVVPIDRRGVLQAVTEQYRSLSLATLLGHKWDNVTNLFVNTRILRGPHLAWSGSFSGSARVAELHILVPAAGLLLLGALAPLLPSARRRLADVKPLAAFTALAIAAWVVLLWGGAITTEIHEGPYVALILFTGLCALAVTALPPVVSGAVLAASAAWFAVEWLPGLTFRRVWAFVPVSDSVDWSMAVLCGCALAAIVVIAVAAATAGTGKRTGGNTWPGRKAQSRAGSAIMDVPTSRKPSRA